MKHPTPKIGPGVSFAREHLVTSCIDASDGVSASLVTLSPESKTDIKVRLDALSLHPFVEKTARRLGYDPHKLMLSWGGWELVCTVQPKQIDAVVRGSSNWLISGLIGFAKPPIFRKASKAIWVSYGASH